MLANITETFARWVCSIEPFHVCCHIFLGHTRWHVVRASSSLQDDWVEVCPRFDVLEIIGLGDGELFGELHLVSFVVEREEALWNEGSRVENTCESCSQEVALLAAEGRIRINISVQVASEDVLDQACLLDVIRAAIRELDPVLQQVGRHPEDSFIYALATHFHGRVL